MKVNDLIEILEKIAPSALAEEWDNSGLNAGDGNSTVKGVLVCVDVTSGAVEAALEAGANVIVSHHPFIFEPVRRFDFAADSKMRLLEKIIKNDIIIIAAHTNWDSAEGGINDTLAEIFGICDALPLAPKTEKTGLGRIGRINPVKTEDLLKTAEETLNIVPRHNKVNKTIHTLAVCGGSGMSLYEAAKKADCYITAEIKRNQFAEASEEGVLLIDLGHFETELPGTKALFEALKGLVSEKVIMYEKDF